MRVNCVECGARNIIPDGADPAHLTCHKCGRGLARARPKLNRNEIRMHIIEQLDEYIDNVDLDDFDCECDVVHCFAEELQELFC